MLKDEYPIGTPLCAVYDLNRKSPIAVDVKVTKVGTRFVTFADERGAYEDRFYPADMTIFDKNFSSPGRVYRSRAEYEDSEEVKRIWREIYSRLSYTPPEGLTPDGVRAIAATLKMEQYLS